MLGFLMLVLSPLSLLSMPMTTMMVHAWWVLSDGIQLWHHYMSAILNTADSPPRWQFHLLSVVRLQTCGRGDQRGAVLFGGSSPRRRLRPVCGSWDSHQLYVLRSIQNMESKAYSYSINSTWTWRELERTWVRCMFFLGGWLIFFFVKIVGLIDLAWLVFIFLTCTCS